MSIKNTRDAAREFIARGYSPIPISKGEKGPHISGWQNLKVSTDQVDALFNANGNIGLLLGAPSGGLVDVDLDADETLPLAPFFLPKTGMIHGRQSKQNSHFWYIATEAGRTTQFKDIDGSSLVELRSTGGQTVVPPSVHPSGEQVAWSQQDEPQRLSFESLLQSTQRLAAATVLVRRYPAQGGRQDFAMALAGTLLKSGWSVDEASNFMHAICIAAKDDEPESRVNTIQRTYEKIKTNSPVTGFSKIVELIGADAYKKIALWLDLKSAPLAANNSKTISTEPRQSQADHLLELGKDIELFHSHHKETFALIENKGHEEVWPLRGTGFRSWLTKNYLEKHQQAPKKQNIHDAIDYFHITALHQKDEKRVFIRTAEHEGKIYLDLGTPEWDVLEIDTEGWRVTKSPVLFYRPIDFGELPHPKECGDIFYFQHLLNTSSDDDLRLMIAWLIGAMRPTGPFPVLILQGEAGSAKSTTAKILRQIIDPCEVALRSLPRNERDMMIAGKSNWINAWDNLSGLNESTSDIVCRISTGGGFATRALYENESEVLFSIQRPVLMNGINDIALRQDLVDRSMVITLPVISDEARRDEKTLWKNFRESHPWLLGYIATAASVGLREFPNKKLNSTPRMADFCRWASSFETALGWPEDGFLESYRSNREYALQASLESDTVATAILDLLKHRREWAGTATELLTALNNYAGPEVSRNRYWPKDATRLSGHLRRHAAGLRNAGVSVEFNKANNRNVSLKIISNTASVSVQRPDISAGTKTEINHKNSNSNVNVTVNATTATLDAKDAKDAKNSNTHIGTTPAGRSSYFSRLWGSK